MVELVPCVISAPHLFRWRMGPSELSLQCWGFGVSTGLRQVLQSGKWGSVRSAMESGSSHCFAPYLALPLFSSSKVQPQCAGGRAWAMTSPPASCPCLPLQTLSSSGFSEHLETGFLPFLLPSFQAALPSRWQGTSYCSSTSSIPSLRPSGEHRGTMASLLQWFAASCCPGWGFLGMTPLNDSKHVS